ncbi:MAG: MMPL family transporter [Xanthomonadales bacterium]|nr:MMPL family transporter [Xanthomonadales bacterium]
METIDRFAWHMANVEGVQQVISLPQIAKVIHAGWNEGNIRWRVLPRDNYVMRQALQNIETDTGLLNAGCSAMPVQIFLTDHKAETIARVVEAVKRFREANDAYDVGFRIALKRLEELAQAEGRTVATDATSLRLATGNAGVMAATNEVVAAAQFPMLAWVYAAVFVLCLFTFRSLLATLCIVLPLALVSLLANALMALLGIGLKVNTLPVAALGVGIGVDYAIYIYSRMEEFLRAGHSLYDSYWHALRLTGTAVIFTALTLAVGVGTWFFSALQFQADMGVLLAFFFLTNMVGAVILLPALLRWLGFARWRAG